jgi:hypothetical protein
MACGLPFLLVDGAIDEVQLWQNTDVSGDSEWMLALAAVDPKIKLVYSDLPLQKEDYAPGHTQFNNSVARFYPTCCEPGTTYLKLDDDLVWYCEGFAQKFVASLDDSACFCIANVVNTPHASFLHDKRGLFGEHGHMINDYYRCHTTLKDGPFCEHIHRRFIGAVKAGHTARWLWDDHLWTGGHTRIGAMAWQGETFAMFGGKVKMAGDEPDLTVRVPQQLKMPIRYSGQALCSHYSFSHQMAHLDKTNILELYGELHP